MMKSRQKEKKLHFESDSEILSKFYYKIRSVDLTHRNSLVLI